MKIRTGAHWKLAGIGAACLALLCSNAAEAQVKLEYKFPEGKKLKYKSTVKTKQILTIQGMEFENEAEQVSVASQTTGKKRDDASIPIEEKVESLRVELTLPGGNNVTFDSSNPDAKIENPALAFLGELLKVAADTSYTVVVDDHFKFKAIEGNEKIIEKAEKLSPQARDLITARVRTEKLKQRFEQEHGNLPDVLTRPGDTWERTEILDASGGQILSFKKKYEYVGTETKDNKTLDKIKSTVTGVELKTDADVDTPVKVVKSELKVAMSEGTILFDREQGHVVSQKAKLHVKDEMVTYSVNGMEVPGGLDFTIETDNELQPSPK